MDDPLYKCRIKNTTEDRDLLKKITEDRDLFIEYNRRSRSIYKIKLKIEIYLKK